MSRPEASSLDGATLVVATHNRGKLEEIADLFDGHGVALKSNADFGLSEPEETETTFAGNAAIKARAAMRATGLPALADDSGLEIEVLGGAPGVHTADWAETGSGRDFGRAMARAWREIAATGESPPYRARFRCALVLAWPDGTEEVWEGEARGQIVWPPRGERGHGYDPIFRPDGHDVTFGEMDRWEKNRMSHRADAFARMKAGLLGG